MTTKPTGRFLFGIIAFCVALVPVSTPAQEVGEPAARNVLGSGTGFCLQAGDKTYHGLLIREIMRQSLLLAAREELQVHIHDLTIGEATPAEVNWELAGSAGNPNLLELLRGQTPSQVSVWQHPMQLPNEPIRYELLLTGLERYSRTLFPKVLKEQLAASFLAATEKPTAVAIDSALLEEPFIVPQFAVIRQAHSTPRDKEFDPARLETLIRGYANLGLLSECYWHPAHVGYKARALLYAQRWATRDPESPRAIYCRAYAWLIAGNSALALADLEQARQLEAGKTATAPTWAKIVQDCCQYKLSQLSSYPATGPHFKMARLLAAVIASRTNEPERAKSIAFLQRRETLSPRLFEGWYELDQQDERTEVWEFAAGHFGASLYDRLSAIPNLPAAAVAIGKQNVDQPQQPSSAAELSSRADLIATLLNPENASPTTEPSNRALGELMQQATLLHAWGGGVTSDDDSHVAPLDACLKQHPYVSILKSEDRIPRKIQAVMNALNYDQLQYKERRLFYLFMKVERDGQSLAFNAAERHRDLIVADFLPRFPFRHPRAAVKLPWQSSDINMARTILAVDPFHPYAQSILVEADWKNVEAKASEWVESAAEHRKLATALGRKLEDAGKHDDAEKLLIASLQINDDLESHRDLALFYSAVGKWEEWQETWDQFLLKNPEAPQRAGILASLAENMLRRKNIDAAEKYALEGAEKGDVNGLLAAGAVYEVKEEWEAAEKFYRQAAESSITREHEWFMFCRRVGKGDEEAAKKLAEGYFEEFNNRDRARRDFLNAGARADLYDFHLGGTFAAALELPRDGLELFQQQFNRTPDPALGLHATFMAVDLKQPETRDRWIARVNSDGKKYRSDDGDVTALLKLAEDIQKDQAAGGKGAIDLAAAREGAKKLNNFRRTDFDYLLGRYYEMCGNAAQAKAAYIHCLSQPTIRHNSRTLAGIGLRRLGGSPADYRDHFRAR